MERSQEPSDRRVFPVQIQNSVSSQDGNSRNHAEPMGEANLMASSSMGNEMERESQENSSYSRQESIQNENIRRELDRDHYYGSSSDEYESDLQNGNGQWHYNENRSLREPGISQEAE